MSLLVTARIFSSPFRVAHSLSVWSALNCMACVSVSRDLEPFRNLTLLQKMQTALYTLDSEGDLMHNLFDEELVSASLLTFSISFLFTVSKSLFKVKMLLHLRILGISFSSSFFASSKIGVYSYGFLGSQLDTTFAMTQMFSQ